MFSLDSKIRGEDRDPAADPKAMLLHASTRYAAYGRDLEYMWHWEILRDGEFGRVVGYVIGSNAGGLALVWLGLALSRG